jgi:mono/diheme cytochrome c family protein
MNVMRLWFAAAAGSLTIALVAAEVRVSAGQAGAGQPSLPTFTAEQATAGKVAYGRSCARCHMPDLGGTPDAPPLSGSRFLDTWRARTTKDLFDFVLGTMPPGGAISSINPDTYAAILAYVLQSNGALSGTTPLEPSTVLPLDRVVRAPSAR